MPTIKPTQSWAFCRPYLPPPPLLPAPAKSSISGSSGLVCRVSTGQGKPVETPGGIGLQGGGDGPERAPLAHTHT